MGLVGMQFALEEISTDDLSPMTKKSKRSNLALAYSVSAILTSNIIGGIVAGYFLDRWLGTAPWLIVTGIVLGTISAFWRIYQIMLQLGSDD